jgi:uncharacterized radical SAM protein YgiQ
MPTNPDSYHPISAWLPITRDEVEQRGWQQPDVIIVSGDAYVDHPAFGPAIIGRLIEAQGFRVAVLPQPNWRDDLRDFKKLGAPRLFFGITAGNMDSMVNHYTAAKRLRSDDAYTPGGKAGFRPDYASVVYTKILKILYPDIPVLLGGVEASMRRFTHYDYWSDQVKPSMLLETGAELLIYGMAEKSVGQLLERLVKGENFSQITNLEQAAYIVASKRMIPDVDGWETLELPAHEVLKHEKKLFAKTFRLWEENLNRTKPARIIQENNEGWLVINPSAPITTEKELDRIYALPYTRLPHPKYKKRGAIPAYEMIKHSITMHRGCFGGCSFCAIAAHQGKFISSRSETSILNEVDQLSKMPGFKGHITDLGGPTANMYRMTAIDFEKCKKCKRASCIFPNICANLNTDHNPLINIYRSVRARPAIKKVTIGSGIRYDLFMDQPEARAKAGGHSKYLRELVLHHVSGRLKVAPEHTSDKVLKYMRKPAFKKFEQLKREFDSICLKNNLPQQIVPYFISSHPGSQQEDMAGLAQKTRSMGFRLEQVQDFTPTPLTLATTMFYTGLDPYTMQKVHVARTQQEKATQHDSFFWHKTVGEKKQEIRHKNQETRRRSQDSRNKKQG